MTAICVSVTEETTEAALARMAALESQADLFEVRADFIRDLDLAALLRARRKPLLFTCRPRSEGGQWPDSDPEGRWRRLLEAARSEVELVDVELRSGFDDVVALRAGRGLLVSCHDLDAMPTDLPGLHAEMAALGADVVKIVGTPRSAADLGRLLAFARSQDVQAPRERGGRWRGLVALAMGPLGVASRILGGRHGAPFTYAAPAAGKEAAPGQLPAETLAEGYRVRSVGRGTRVYGILGVDVLRSLSPAIHNRAFAERRVDAVYVPLQAESLPAFLEALSDLDLSGFSVTRPWKSEILPHLAEVHPEAARAGSVNTVLVRDGQLVGSSTDGDGILVPLRHHLAVSGRDVTLVGAGGAARAAALALVGVGARVRVLARREEQAAAVAADVGCHHGPLGALGEEPWDVLINASPVGSGAFPGEMPVPAAALRPGAVVFDMVYEPRETPLLRAARDAGCRTIDGIEMLVAQAVGQFETWTGIPAPVEAMTEAAHAAIGEGP